MTIHDHINILQKYISTPRTLFPNCIFYVIGLPVVNLAIIMFCGFYYDVKIGPACVCVWVCVFVSYGDGSKHLIVVITQIFTEIFGF